MKKHHSFHIPVMGLGFTVDTPLKVAHLGIDSVIAVGDDQLLEKMRKALCEKFSFPYEEITDKWEDFRARRITSYLNLINELVEKKYEALKSAAQDKSQELKDYFHLLPDTSHLKEEFRRFTEKHSPITDIRNWVKDNLSLGSIDINIMTKLDKENYRLNQKLPVEYNDAHAALRGFANSDLQSSVVFSAGMNPRLYGYLEQFDDFYPDANGNIRKKIILKVSDYRSALIQGRFFAKKGLWVSEYRIESGLNCGGHAFATDGYLMGPILAEFRDRREELIQATHALLIQALSSKSKPVPAEPLPLRITAQGGVGTAEEHEFLLDHYQLDSVGWGTPFLLVPEVTNVDEKTLSQLETAKEDDLYLSRISPLGVPFNSLRGNSKELEHRAWVEEGIPGNPCRKKHLTFNTEFTEKPICTASRQYQHLKIKELNQENLSDAEYNERFERIVEKNCLCTGLGTAALLNNKADTTQEGIAVAICPGPNLAYFDRILSLKEMVDHIYGRTNVISRTDRPHMFVKELQLYINYLKDKLKESTTEMNNKQRDYFNNFSSNLKDGIEYYSGLFKNLKKNFFAKRQAILSDLQACEQSLQHLEMEIREKAGEETLVAK